MRTCTLLLPLILLNNWTNKLAFGNRTPLDFGIALKAIQSGKNVLGLETVFMLLKIKLKIAATANKKEPDDQVALQRLRQFLDAGGITYAAKELNDLLAAYVSGDSRTLFKIYDRMERLYYEEEDLKKEKANLNHRNYAWVKKGTIQNHCQHGNKCLIAVGWAHLEDNNTDTLIDLLTAEGFEAERVME